MKLTKKVFAVILCVLALGCIMCVNVLADDGVPWSQNLTVNQKTGENIISYGLDVIAYKNDMAIAGIMGNALNFTSERFACAMNLSRVDSITVTKLPDQTLGSLYIGSEGVSVGQKISAANIALMTYEETDLGIGKNNSFMFTVNDAAYEIVCNVFMIDEINYSPTLSLASYASLNTETYKNIAVGGVLSAYDPEGDGIRFEIVRYPENGTVVMNDRDLGIYTYIPSFDFSGEDSFKYVVRDRFGNYSSASEVSVTVKTQSASTVYNDLIGDDLYSHAIAMTENGLMNGVQIGNYFYFDADREVTRAEFLVTAMNAIGIKSVPDVDKTVFADDSDIYDEMKGYVSLAYSKKFISGITVDGKLYFRPDEAITMSEVAVIISNMIGYAEPKVAPAFADADKIPAWSGKAIESLHTLGILECPDMITGACNNITRGDMAKILNKTMFVIGK